MCARASCASGLVLAVVGRFLDLASGDLGHGDCGANEALAKREKRAGISRSDHGWFMLQALEQADNDALEMVYDLIVNSAKLQGLKKAMQEKAEQKAKRLETLAENKKKREAAAKAKAEEKRAAKAAALTAPTMAPQDSAPAAPV